MRDLALSLARIAETCVRTVPCPMKRASAISALERPSTRSRSTSRSRAVRPSAAVAATAVWVGTTEGVKPLVNQWGSPVYGSGLPSDIWKSTMDGALQGTDNESFPKPTEIGGYAGVPQAPPPPPPGQQNGPLVPNPTMPSETVIQPTIEVAPGITIPVGPPTTVPIAPAQPEADRPLDLLSSSLARTERAAQRPGHPPVSKSIRRALRPAEASHV